MKTEVFIFFAILVVIFQFVICELSRMPAFLVMDGVVFYVALQSEAKKRKNKRQ